MTDNRKATIVAAFIGVLVTATAALVWDTFAAGTEAQIADNPAFAELQSQIDDQKEEIVELKTRQSDELSEVKSAVAANGAKLDAVGGTVNQILDAILSE